MTFAPTSRMMGARRPAAIVSCGLLLFFAAGADAIARPGSRQRVKKGATHVQHGLASWYGPGFDGKPTASGEIFDMKALTAAHRTLPLGTMIEVRNLDNGLTTTARVNDRGPHVKNRIVDLSLGAAQALGIDRCGVARVRLTVVDPVKAPPPSRYWVQVGAFQSEDNARALRVDLERRYPGTEVNLDSGWFQVRVPSGAKRRAAEALRRDLARAGYDETIVVRQPRSNT